MYPIRLLFLFLFLVTTSLNAQDIPAEFDIPLPNIESYSSDIPSPEDVLGHIIGSRHTEPHQIVEYVKAVTAASDRAVFRSHGKTHEGRPLVHALISSPENLSRLDEIKETHWRLSDDPASVSDADLESLPAVIWMGYSIHGNEASGSEAGLLALYHLAAGQGDFMDELLANTIVILDPCFNPDGRDRFTGWVNRNRGHSPSWDSQDREHNEAWPGGRTNHYWFDLNRDWLPAQHPESQGRLSVFHEWRPVLLTDHHEMGSNSSFYFMPGIPSRNNPNTDLRNYELTGMVAEFHAERLDAIGALYYSKESFDDFYYGKGSTFPDINGAVGILFEQASSRALLRETSTGKMDYAYGIRNHFSTSLSTLDAVHAHRIELLKAHRDFYAKAQQQVASSNSAGWVFDVGADRSRAKAFIELMHRHDILVHRLNEDFGKGDDSFKKTRSFVIPSNQRQSRLINAMMERVTTFQDSLFYDVSTWTLPLAFGLRHGQLSKDKGAIGPLVTLDFLQSGQVIGGPSKYGYLMAWGDYYGPKVLHELQKQSVYPRMLHDAFEAAVDGSLEKFGKGTLFIPAKSGSRTSGDSKSSLHGLVDRLSKDYNAVFYALDSGYTPQGPDMGSGSASTLHEAKIAIISGPGTSSYRVGEVWHLLSERLGVAVALLDAQRVNNADLDRYNTMVMPGGSYGDINSEKITNWVRSGGTLVATTSGASWAVDKGLVDLEKISTDVDSLFADLPFDKLSAARGAQVIGGSIFETELETSHPLTYGYTNTMPVFRQGTTLYKASDKAGTNVAVYSDAPLLSGYISEEMLEKFPGAASVNASRLGRGRVVTFFDNPNFRAFWYGTNGMFLNAIFLRETF